MAPTQSSPRSLGRYVLSAPIAVGGMASVHFGKLSGAGGFRRTVAIKRMLQTYASNPQARAMLMDEARLTARVNHPNVVQTLDVVEDGGELFLVLEYVHGESLDRLLERSRERGRRPPVRVVTAVLVGALRGLHAAHEARGEDGRPLELVHRDVSPHNIMVDAAGVARVLDFGIARARGRLQATQDGQLKGKLAYLAPEQVHGESSRRTDLFACGVVLWECLTLRQLFEGTSEADLLSKVLLCKVPPLETHGVAEPALEAVLSKALERDPERRHGSAAELADALEALGLATQAEVSAWVMELAAEDLAGRDRSLAELDRLVPAEPSHGPLGATKRPLSPWGEGQGEGQVVGSRALGAQPSPGSSSVEGSVQPERSRGPNAPAAPGAQPSPEGSSPEGSVQPAGSRGPTAAAALGAQSSQDAPRVRTIWRTVAVLAVAGLGVALAAQWSQRSQPRAETRPENGSETTSPPAPQVAVPTRAPSPPPVDSDRQPRGPIPVAADPRAADPRPTPHARPPVKPPAATPVLACDPPWIIDSAGVKRFKVECLK